MKGTPTGRRVNVTPQQALEHLKKACVDYKGTLADHQVLQAPHAIVSSIVGTWLQEQEAKKAQVELAKGQKKAPNRKQRRADKAKGRSRANGASARA